jgi:hypothetical protein
VHVPSPWSRGHVRGWVLSLWAAASVALLGAHLVTPIASQTEDAWWPWVTGLMAFPVAAAVVLIHRPGNGVGRTLLVVALAANVIFLSASIADAAPASEATRWVEALGNGGVALQFAGLVVLLWVFPTGRPPGGLVVAFRVLLVTFGALVVLFTLAPAPLPITGRPNPVGIDAPLLRWVERDGFVLVPLGAVVGVASLLHRRRGADVTTRAQLRWFLAGAAAVLVLFALVTLTSTSADPRIEAAAGALIVVGFWGLPAAITVAIVRFHLFDIDRVVSRTLAYAVVVTVLAGAYALAVVTLRTLVPLAGSDLAVAASTLLVAALFAPLRRRVQAVVDRRFNRARVEAAEVAERFARELRTEVDLHAVSRHLTDTVGRTLQPASAGVWLTTAALTTARDPVAGPASTTSAS